MTSQRDFAADQELLTGILDEVLRASGAEETLRLRGEAVELAHRARDGDDAAGDALAALIEGLNIEQLELLVRSLTRWFQLVNLAEDNERVRRIRARAAREAPAPRRGSMSDAIASLVRREPADHEPDERDLATFLAHAETRLVMTAHPTEARRRTTIDKQARIFRELRDLDDRVGYDHAAAHERIRATVQELWTSDELRAASLTVLDEVRGGLVHFTSTLAETIPLIYRELEHALSEHFPEDPPPAPPLLRFGSWIGGDRDGNPFVTPAMTTATLELMREQCVRFLEGRVGLIAGRLSLSDRVSGPAPALQPILDHGESHFPELAGLLNELNPEEPYRRALTYMRERVRATAGYGAAGYAEPSELLSDLRTIERSLKDGPGAFTATTGDLHDVIRQVEVFRFHFATLDVRQHAKVHHAALQEIFHTLEVCENYEVLDDVDRLLLLQRHIADRRPLIPADIARFSDSTRETIETFRAIRAALRGPHKGAIDAYVISGTEGPADVLEVLLLMKESSLTRAGGEQTELRIVPLFEAGATLAAAAETMQTLLDIPVYRTALESVGNLQEVMIGYSDSNKDVGYVASGWGAYRAQSQIADVLRGRGVSWMFFHGRGGAVGRGGGPTHAAITALPPGTVDGRLKMTEQGEVLNTKYTVQEVAHRELELSVSATLTAGRSPVQASNRDEHELIVQEMADRSASVYRALVHDDPDFVAFFLAATPVEEVSRLRLGSRPARRQAAGGINDLRAIPWVFSWTQSRIILPAWLGLGTALAEARAAHGTATLQEMVESWPFFAALISNAEMACAKADPGIAARYAALFDDEVAGRRIWTQLAAEFLLAREELQLIRGEGHLLDSEPVLQASINRRNPYVDPLSFIQIELLRRRRSATDADAETPALERVSLLTINGIASGLRNTG